jgi:hypothetical protein
MLVKKVRYESITGSSHKKRQNESSAFFVF